jgi:radical SAM superfamily enzyme YgiQ (UPF0313 family)
MIVLFNDSPFYPNRSVGVYRIATVLRRAGCEVEVIDFLRAWELDGPKQFFKYLDTIKEVEWWGFSSKFPLTPGLIMGSTLQTKLGQSDAFYSFSTKEFEQRLINYIRGRNGTIVVGGPNAYPLRKVIPATHADILCDGYADNGVLAIHDHIINRGPLVYECEGSFKIVDCNKDYGDIDLSNIDVDYDNTDFIGSDEMFPVEITRGCIFQCAFCTHTHTGKKAGTYIRSKESIKKDIVDRYEKYGSLQFSFVDDTFNDSIEKMEMIAEIRRETDIPFKFWSYGRLDLLRSQPRMVELIGETGWSSVTFGVETFNRSSGKAIGKGADPQKLKDFLIKLRETYPELLVRVNIIIGLPDDTEESATDTVQWFLDNPGVADKVSIKPLGISERGSRRIIGKIGENIAHYGYKELPEKSTQNISAQTINWVNKNSMTQEDATRIAKRLRNLIKQDHNKTSIHSMGRGMMVSEDGESKISEEDKQRIVAYLRAKKQSRGI